MPEMSWSEQGCLIMAAFFAGIAAGGVTFLIVTSFMEIMERLWA